jgi:hypothetical protein
LTTSQELDRVQERHDKTSAELRRTQAELRVTQVNGKLYLSLAYSEKLSKIKKNIIHIEKHYNFKENLDIFSIGFKTIQQLFVCSVFYSFLFKQIKFFELFLTNII